MDGGECVKAAVLLPPRDHTSWREASLNPRYTGVFLPDDVSAKVVYLQQLATGRTRVPQLS